MEVITRTIVWAFMGQIRHRIVPVIQRPDQSSDIQCCLQALVVVDSDVVQFGHNAADRNAKGSVLRDCGLGEGAGTCCFLVGEDIGGANAGASSIQTLAYSQPTPWLLD